MLRQVEIREPEQHRKSGKHDELWLWGFCEDVEICWNKLRSESRSSTESMENTMNCDFGAFVKMLRYVETSWDQRAGVAPKAWKTRWIVTLGLLRRCWDKLRQVEIREPEQHRKYREHGELWLWGFCEDVEICWNKLRSESRSSTESMENTMNCDFGAFAKMLRYVETSWDQRAGAAPKVWKTRWIVTLGLLWRCWDMLRQVEIREPEQHRKYGKHDELWLTQCRTNKRQPHSKRDTPNTRKNRG